MIEFNSAAMRFGDRDVLRDLTFSVQRGQFTALVGPSGCGKSTILNLCAGLLAPTAGAIAIDGQPLAGLNPQAGYLFQQDSLLPWKTVLENVALPVTLRGENGEPGAQKWLARMGLTDFAHYYPEQLSGGMKKRASLAQCWMAGRDILLMDEPFSALDIHTRQRMEHELLALWQEERRTVLFVTHDLEEAISLADVVMVLSAGPGSHIVGRYEVPLARPRAVRDLRLDPRFQDLYRAIWHDLRAEVDRSHVD